MNAALAAVEVLRETYARIAATRMADLPVCNTALAVETIGFAPADGPAEGERGWLGILLTPWCMNLIWLPASPDRLAAPGHTRTHRLAGERYSFIGAEEAGVGRFEMCSLFSPVFEFADQDSACCVAQAVLAQLRTGRDEPAQPSRRRLFAGFAAAGEGTPL